MPQIEHSSHAPGYPLRPVLPVLALALPASASAARDGSPDLVRDARPILTASCVECHGATKAKGGLRLDSRAAALKGGTSGPSILPGKGNESYLVQRIKGLGDEPQMPEKKP